MAEFQLPHQTVLITRPAEQADSMAKLLKNAGFSVLVHPVIEILEPDEWRDVDDAIDHLLEFDWLVFASVNGVRFFHSRFLQRLPQGSSNYFEFADSHFKVAAIGSRTAEELQSVGWQVELQPKQFDSEGFADALIERVVHENVLLIRASRGSQEIPRRLQMAGIRYRQIAVYRSVDVLTADPAITTAMQRGEIDWVTVTSSAIAQGVVNLFGEDLRKTKLVSISPTTSAVLIELGFHPEAEAKEFTMPGVANAIVRNTRQ